MKSFGSNKRTLLILAILTIALLVGHYFLFRDIRLKNENTSKLLDHISEESNKGNYILTSQKALQNIAPDLEVLKKTIVGSTGEVEFIEYVESLARANGLSIVIDNLQTENDQKLLASSSVTLLKVRARTNGSWTGTYKFISLVESLPYRVRVNSFSMTAQGVTDATSGATKNGWESNLEIRVLKYK